MISCVLYDHIEVVCMYRYPVKLTLKFNETVEGIAFDTQKNSTREECLAIEVNGKELLIVLDSISKMEVCVKNPHFHIVHFT